MWKIPNFSGSTPVRNPLCTAENPRENSFRSRNAHKPQPIGHISSLTVNAHIHSVTHGQLRKPQHTYVKRAVRKTHFKLNGAFRISGSFKVILNGVGRNPKRGVDVRYNNVDLIPETYEDTAPGNCKFVNYFCQPTPVWRQLSDKNLRIYK